MTGASSGIGEVDFPRGGGPRRSPRAAGSRGYSRWPESRICVRAKRCRRRRSSLPTDVADDDAVPRGRDRNGERTRADRRGGVRRGRRRLWSARRIPIRRVRRRPPVTNLHGPVNLADTSPRPTRTGIRQLRARRLAHRAPRGAGHGGVRAQQVGVHARCPSAADREPGSARGAVRRCRAGRGGHADLRAGRDLRRVRRSPTVPRGDSWRWSRAGSWPSPTVGGTAVRWVLSNDVIRPGFTALPWVYDAWGGATVPGGRAGPDPARGAWLRQRARPPGQDGNALRSTFGNALVGVGRNRVALRQGRGGST